MFFSRPRRGKPEEAGSLAGLSGKSELLIVAERVPFSLRMVSFSGKDRLFFFDQMATLIGSNVALLEALSVVQAQTKSARVKTFYAEVIRRINGGSSLSDTLSLFPRAFNSIQTALIAAGEKSGNLKRVLEQVVDDLENQQDFVRKIKGAMFYPLVVMVLALTMVAGMMIFVIPKVAALYKQSNTALPILTQKIIDLSGFVRTNAIPLFGGGLVFLALFWLFVRKIRIGILFWENVVSALPLFGRVSKEKNIMVFASTLSMLLESGVLISDAFEITAKTVDNLHYRKALTDIRHGIVLGKNVSELMGLKDIRAQQFEYNPLFPLQVAQLVHIGEVTGTIAKMLAKIRSNYKKSIDYTLKNLSTIIEPLMIFIVAALVGSILLGVMLPFFYIGSTIR